MTPSRRILFFSHSCYLDDSNGATVASRAMMEALSRHGFEAEALTGTVFESAAEIPPESWMRDRGIAVDMADNATVMLDGRGLHADGGDFLRAEISGVSATFHIGRTSRPHEADHSEREGILSLLARTLDRFRPDVVINFGGDILAHQARALSRGCGAAVVFALHNFSYTGRDTFETADAAIVPSRFAAEHYSKTIGLACTVLPNLVDVGRAFAPDRDPRYLTFVNPSREKGVYAFAKIADELGRKRSDIPVLVVESRGTEDTLVGCGIDLREHGNVFLMAQTPDPRDFWRATRVCIMPSLWWENQPLVAIEAMINGIPVLGSDRGGIPETLGDCGIVLPIPQRLTPFTLDLPTDNEVAPWIDAIVRLWDDEDYYAKRSRQALVEARRWAPEILEPEYVAFFQGIRPGRAPLIPFG